MFVEQLINLREVLTENLEFRTAHLVRIEPKSLDSLLHTLNAELQVHIDFSKKTVYNLLPLATCNCFFACRIVVLGLLMLNIKARQDIP